jgi:excisionase family DNA binding protein
MKPAPPVPPASSFDALLDVLADRLAEKLYAKLAQDGAGAPVRPRLLTVEQAAAYLGRTKEAVQHMVGSGKLPVVRADRRLSFDVRDLDGWIERNKTTAV